VRRLLRKKWTRRVAAVFALSAGLVLLAHPFAGAASDVWSNVGPASPLGSNGLYNRFPLSHYMLDQHFDAISASLTGGVDASGVAPMIAFALATMLWALTSFLANLLISLFAFAFSLDLVNGSDATGGAGALGPVSQAIHALYASVFGAPWLVLAVSVAGIWAMWRALVQRRYAETAGALGLSLIYVVAALFFVAQPGQTIGAASKWTNRMSVAFLSVSSHGSASGGAQATEGDARQLFDLLVFKPWSVLEFGGLEHCALENSGSAGSDPESVAVRPLSSDPGRDASLARRLAAGEEITADGKVCVNNAAKYGSHFLRFAIGSDERNAEYDALNHGDSSKLPEADPQRGGYRLGVADKPATDAMEEGGQYQRLLVAIVVFVGELGAFCLLGTLSVGVILAQVLLLLLLAFAPVALVAAAIPGRGHAFFRGWLEKLAGYLLRKAAYSLLLAILLAVNGALASATDSLGWLMSFGLQALFFWAVFLQRKALSEGLIGIATGPGAPGREGALRVLGLYYGARVAGRGARSTARAARSVAGAPGRALERLNSRRAAKSASPAGPAPLFGTSYSRPVGRGAPPVEAPRRAKPTERGRAGGERGKGREETAPRPDPWRELAEHVAESERRRERDERPARRGRPRDPGSPKSAGEDAARRARPAPPDPPEAQPREENGDGDSLEAELRAERERRRRTPRKPSGRKPTEDSGRRKPRRFTRLRRGRRRRRGR
jgi:hypothetical protein